MARRSVLALALPLALPLALSACTPATERSEVTELQSLCVSSGSSDGQTTEVTFDLEFDACLSSSCDTLVESSCEASVVDGVIEVSGTATIDFQVKGECTADCGVPTAQCTLEVAGGTYTVRGEGLELEYEIGAASACATS